MTRKTVKQGQRVEGRQERQPGGQKDRPAAPIEEGPVRPSVLTDPMQIANALASRDSGTRKLGVEAVAAACRERGLWRLAVYAAMQTPYEDTRTDLLTVLFDGGRADELHGIAVGCDHNYLQIRGEARELLSRLVIEFEARGAPPRSQEVYACIAGGTNMEARKIAVNHLEDEDGLASVADEPGRYGPAGSEVFAMALAKLEARSGSLQSQYALYVVASNSGNPEIRGAMLGRLEEASWLVQLIRKTGDGTVQAKALAKLIARMERGPTDAVKEEAVRHLVEQAAGSNLPLAQIGVDALARAGKHDALCRVLRNTPMAEIKSGILRLFSLEWYELGPDALYLLATHRCALPARLAAVERMAGQKGALHAVEEDCGSSWRLDDERNADNEKVRQKAAELLRQADETRFKIGVLNLFDAL